MPIDQTNLNRILKGMKKIFVSDPARAVKGQIFIRILHSFCVDELKKRGLNQYGLEIVPEAKILTSHKMKDMDVGVIHPTSGPLLIIALRSQMSSLSKNFSNYFEMEVGDVSAIHERFPLCVVGLLYLHPSRSILPGKEKESFNFSRAEKMFLKITDRDKQSDPYGVYEEVAYLKVDFHLDPPRLDKDFPSDQNLRVEDFFDKLLQKFKERNFPLLK